MQDKCRENSGPLRPEHVSRLDCNSNYEASDLQVTYPHLRIRLIFYLEVGVRSLGAETGGQGGFANAAPWIVLLTVRGNTLESGEERTLQVHCSWNTEGPIVAKGEGKGVPCVNRFSENDYSMV